MKISLCIICKNEEKKIGRCIKSVKAVVDEIIVVDTGSSDRTVEIVKEFGAKVYEISWENNFSKARNFALDQAIGDWIVFLDADEYFVEESRNRLRELIEEAENQKMECIICEMINEVENGIQSVFKTIRIFKHSPEIRYVGSIHERICKKDTDIQAIDFIDQVKIWHDGYSESILAEKDKVERNLKMLLEASRKNPEDSDLCYYLVETYCGQNNLEKVWEYAQKALEYNNFQLTSSKIGVYERLIHACLVSKKDLEVVKSFYIQAVQVDEKYPDFDFRYAQYLYSIKQYEESIKYLNLCIAKLKEYKGTTPSSIIGNPVEVLELLADSYLLEGRYNEGIPILVKILRINPYNVKALYNLISILSTSEEAVVIGQFLEKLYDYNNPKDQMLLIQMSEKMDNKELHHYILGHIDTRLKN